GGAAVRPGDGSSDHAAEHSALYRQWCQAADGRQGGRNLYPTRRLLPGDTALCRFAEPSRLSHHRAEARREFPRSDIVPRPQAAMTKCAGLSQGGGYFALKRNVRYWRWFQRVDAAPSANRSSG